MNSRTPVYRTINLDTEGMDTPELRRERRRAREFAGTMKQRDLRHAPRLTMAPGQLNARGLYA